MGVSRGALLQWQRYMRCDGTPDPTIAGEINSYINLSHEDRASVDIDSVLRESTNMLAVSGWGREGR